MDKIAEQSLLYDLYGGLLTEKKRSVLELYHEENLSLSEIAEEQGISRAAVHDALKSAERNLAEYEERLGLAKDYRNRQKTVAGLRREISDILSKSDASKAQVSKIEELLSLLED